VIPGLERFYIVSTGNVVIPQARGQALNECYG
jgi:ribosomal protein S12 methylthiotransferase accessory factor